MTHAKLDTQAGRLAEIRDIAINADKAADDCRIYDARLVARLARLIEAEMLANDEGGLVG